MEEEKMVELIKENEKLIYSIAKKYSTYYCIEDLYQVGIIGLIKATKNFNKSIENKFSSYAYKYILGEIISFIKKDRNIKISDEMFSIYKMYLKIKERLTSINQKEATINEISKFMGISEEELVKIIESVSFTKSIESEDIYFTDERESIDNKIMINDEISLLDSLQQSIIKYRYYQGYNQEQTANILGLSQSKVSREEKLILTKMKNNLN